MISTILSLGGIVGLVVGAGFMGGFIARCKAPSVEIRIKPPWSAYDRAILVENIGFLSGAAGGGFILLLSLILWWLGRLHIDI